MNVLIAARQLTRGYPAKLEGIAALLEKSPTTLRHEIAGAPGAKLGVEDVIDMTVAAIAAKQPNALVILNSIAGSCGCEVRLLPTETEEVGQCNSGRVLRAISACTKEFSDLVMVATSAEADDHVTDNELRAVEKECSELITQAQAVLAAMVARNKDSKTNRTRRGGAR
jgi:hypothetical protein